jgi:hypothetical protein
MIAPSARMMSLASLTSAKSQKTTFSDDRQHQLDNAGAKHAYPAQLEGVVTYSDADWGLLFLEDATGGFTSMSTEWGSLFPPARGSTSMR